MMIPEPVFAFPVRVVGSLVLAAAVAILILDGTRGDREIAPLAPPDPPMPMVKANPAPPFVTFSNLTASVPLQATVPLRPVTVRQVSAGDAGVWFFPVEATR